MHFVFNIVYDCPFMFSPQRQNHNYNYSDETNTVTLWSVFNTSVYLPTDFFAGSSLIRSHLFSNISFLNQLKINWIKMFFSTYSTSLYVKFFSGIRHKYSNNIMTRLVDEHVEHSREVYRPKANMSIRRNQTCTFSDRQIFERHIKQTF